MKLSSQQRKKLRSFVPGWEDYERRKALRKIMRTRRRRKRKKENRMARLAIFWLTAISPNYRQLVGEQLHHVLYHERAQMAQATLNSLGEKGTTTKKVARQQLEVDKLRRQKKAARRKQRRAQKRWEKLPERSPYGIEFHQGQ